MFNTAKGDYEEALKHSGYSNNNLSFYQSSTNHVKRQRHRNIIWFNPPYSRAVITNVAKKFLQLIDLHFPPSNKFHKISNRNNVKVSTVSHIIWEILSNHTTRNLLTQATIMSSHATVEKKKIVLWRGNAELKT